MAVDRGTGGARVCDCMTHDQLLALDVAQWADDDCHLYCWTTNNFMPRAVELVARWGFQHKTVLTWNKPRWGLGSYFRNSTEHVLFAVRGELRTRWTPSPLISRRRWASTAKSRNASTRSCGKPRMARSPRSSSGSRGPIFRNVYGALPTSEAVEESYDASDDMRKSVNYCLSEVKNRMAAGGQKWPRS